MDKDELLSLSGNIIKVDTPEEYVEGKYDLWNLIKVDTKAITNPYRNHNGDDCAVRAVAKLLLPDDGDWKEQYDYVYSELAHIGIKGGYIMNHLVTIAEMLDGEGYTGVIPNDDISAATFLATHKFGKYLISVDGHMYAYLYGVVYDDIDMLEYDMLMLGHNINMVFCDKHEINNLF